MPITITRLVTHIRQRWPLDPLDLARRLICRPVRQRAHCVCPWRTNPPVRILIRIHVVRIPTVWSDGAETVDLRLGRLLLLLELWGWRGLADAVAGDLH